MEYSRRCILQSRLTNILQSGKRVLNISYPLSSLNIEVLCTHNVGEGRSVIFTLVKGMFTIIKKGTNDWIERMICACTIMI